MLYLYTVLINVKIAPDFTTFGQPPKLLDQLRRCLTSGPSCEADQAGIQPHLPPQFCDSFD